MSDPLIQTKVTEFLRAQNVPHRILRHITPATTIEDAAQQRGISPRKMVKSILLRDMDNNYALACVPGDLQADPKKVRNILQCRRMTCVGFKDVPAITGFEPGTVVPVLLNTEMPVFFDNIFINLPEVTISSGSNMAGIALKTEDLIALCHPVFGDIVRT